LGINILQKYVFLDKSQGDFKTSKIKFKSLLSREFRGHQSLLRTAWQGQTENLKACSGTG
jgi:hypothetical protein